jgi:dipeptidyl-peptidase-4
VLTAEERVLKVLILKVTQYSWENEVEDQIDAAKVIGNYSFVDKSRIYLAGHMVDLCLKLSFQRERYFKMAAVAPCYELEIL